MAFFSSSSLSPCDVERYPELAQLMSISRQLSGAPFASFVPALTTFLSSRFLGKFIKNELTALRDEPRYARITSETTVEIVKVPDYTIHFGILKGLSGRGFDDVEVTSYAADIIQYNVGPRPIPFELYRTPDGQINEIFDRRSIPSLVKRSFISPGEVMFLEGGRDIFKLLPCEYDAVQVTVVSQHEKSLDWHYDYTTMEALYCSAGRNSSSTLQHAMTILVKCGCVRAAPDIALAYNSKDHFVRWSAVRAVLALNEDLGRKLLDLARDDPHPHVRTAAIKTHKLLGSSSFA